MRPVAATGSTRYIKRAMTVRGYYLPKGTMVDVPFYAVGHLARSMQLRHILRILRGRASECDDTA